MKINICKAAKCYIFVVNNIMEQVNIGEEN